MPRSPSLDLRSRTASAAMAGATVRSVAARFAATVVRLGKKARAGDDLRARPRGAPPEPIIRDAVAEWVRSRLSEKSGLTVRALAAEPGDRTTTVTHDTVRRFMREEGLTTMELWSQANRTAPSWPICAAMEGSSAPGLA